MEDLPPLPSSRNSPRAPSAQSSSPGLNESHLYIRDFIGETRQRLNFTPVQLPILDDHQLSGLSDGETILVPLSCSTLNALASMTRQLDTITTQLGSIQQAVHTMPTWTALEGVLTPINAAIRDLSHRVTAPPPQAPAPTRPPVPPTGATTRQAPAPTRPAVPPAGTHAPPLPRPKTRAPPPDKGPAASFDPDIPRYDVGTRSFYGDPRAYADRFPDSWEANAFREGKYPDPTTFIAGHLAPDCPKPQRSYAKVATAGAPKGKKNKSSLTAAQVASASNSVSASQPPKSLPTAERRFYAPRSSPSEHQQASLIAATFPDIAARVLRDANCVLPLAVTTKVNDRGSVTLLVTDPTTPAAAFAPYFDALSAQLNKSFPVGESPWLPFRLAPNEAQLAIHSLPIAFLPEDPEELFPCLAESILNSKNIRILAARYLNPDPRSREGKSATSVIVSVHPGEVSAMGSSIRLFSRSRTVERAYSSNRYTQCKNCWGFGHVAPRCPSADPTCPIYSLNHTRAMHRCPNPTCPGGGNLKATPGCCSSSPPRCTNCESAHTATHRDCVSRPAPPTLRRSTAAETIVLPPPAGDEMDTAADEDDLSPPASPTRSLQSAFEMATPRARSSTILPASVGPAQGNRSLPPAEPVSPSPMSRTPSGLAR